MWISNISSERGTMRSITLPLSVTTAT
ncbi:hypothetical protein LINPERPRIM_LOCUS22574 [Linum perenne]